MQGHIVHKNKVCNSHSFDSPQNFKIWILTIEVFGSNIINVSAYMEPARGAGAERIHNCGSLCLCGIHKLTSHDTQ